MGEGNRDINTGEDGTNPMEEGDVGRNRIENDKVSDPVADSIVEAIDSEKKKWSRKRSRTEDDKISKNAEKHPLLPPCNNCDMKCVELIKEERSASVYRVKSKYLGYLVLSKLQSQNGLEWKLNVKESTRKQKHITF